MLAKKFRLTKTRDIIQTTRRGRTFFSSHLTVKHFIPVSLPRELHATIIVSTKVSKRAVVRNTLKRIARDVLQHKLADLPFGNWIIYAKPAATTLTKEAWHEQIEQRLDQAIASQSRTASTRR